MSRHIVLTPQQQALLGDADTVTDVNAEALLSPVLCEGCATAVPLGWLGRAGCRRIPGQNHYVQNIDSVTTHITDLLVNHALRGRS